MSTRSSIKNPSEFVRCRKTINVIYMSLFLLLIGIILLAVGSSKLNKTITGSANDTSDLKLENIDKDVKNIIIAGIFLCSISVLVIFISSLVAVSQGCYKTGIFGLVFTFLI